MHYLINVTISYCFHDAWITLTWWFHTFFHNIMSCDAVWFINTTPFVTSVLPPTTYLLLFELFACVFWYFFKHAIYKWIIKGGLPLMFQIQSILYIYIMHVLSFFLQTFPLEPSWNSHFLNNNTNVSLWSWGLIHYSRSHT